MDKDHFKRLGPPPPPPPTYWDVWLWPMAAFCGVTAFTLNYLSDKAVNEGDAISYTLVMLPFAAIGAACLLGGLISSANRFFGRRRK
jgi:hypothetical protein